MKIVNEFLWEYVFDVSVKSVNVELWLLFKKYQVLKKELVSFIADISTLWFIT